MNETQLTPDTLSANVLILGKTGVGKSSFINYLFGEDVRETGSGRPVTEEGIYRNGFVLENGLAVNLYDTWGLEADKASAWETIVEDEMKRHNTTNIRDWFHSVIYCLSAKSARVEAFEIGLINRLNDGGNRVIVVLTHSDLNNVEEPIAEMSRVLREECGLAEEDILKVASVSKKLLGGRVTKQFGREAVIGRITDDLWLRIVDRVPKQIRLKGEALIEKWHEESAALIEERVNFLSSASVRALGKLGEDVYEGAVSYLNDFSAYSDALINETVDYYRRFLEKSQGLLSGGEGFSFTDQLLTGEKYPTLVQGVVLQAPSINLLTPWSWAENRKTELKGYLAYARTKIEELLEEYIRDVEDFFRKTEWPAVE